MAGRFPMYSPDIPRPKIVIDKDYVVSNQLPKTPIPKCSVAEVIAKCMIQWNDLDALIDPKDGTRVSFNELLNRSKRFAKFLIKFGLTKKDLVYLYGENSLQCAFAYFGLVFAGLIMSPVTPANAQFELIEQIKDSEGTSLIIDRQKLPILKLALDNEEYRKTIDKYLKLVVVLNCNQNDPLFEEIKNIISANISMETFDQTLEKISDNDVQNMKVPYYDTKPEDHFIIIYTSGTTGKPKGAIHSNHSTLAFIINQTPPPPIDLKGQMSLLWYPFGHASGSFLILSNVACGVITVVFEDNDLDKLLDFAVKNKVIALSLSPRHVNIMAQQDLTKQYDFTHIKHVMSGGSKIPVEYGKILCERYGVGFEEIYGATEFMFPVKNFDLYFEPYPMGTVGHPFPGNEVKILDTKTGKNLPLGENGEICIRGDGIFVGYLNNEKATSTTIDSERWFHTGDLGYLTNKGHLFVLDRIKEIIKFRHWSIYPSEIEYFLTTHPSIKEACVVGIKHTTDFALLRAYIEIQNDSEVTEQEIIKYVEENMGFQKRLRAGVKFIKTMPRTSIGKIDRKYFRQLIKDEILTDKVE